MSITRTTSVSTVSDDGMTRTEIHVTQVCRGPVDSAVPAVASAAAVAQSDTKTHAAHDVASGDCGCGCFDVDASCDEREKAMIAALRAYLRPDQAPECLMAKLNAVLDRCCGQ
ncbi:hypothetical protein EMO90_10775 [Bifidobacterium vespertilionis]|uniref:Uncharacterized protein n=1 Tax=Bifidobacterium vespertilionis TaxID=2562524 RepID=A0A5J5DSZ6_9BIFI|nr:hypothetical protein EMO90_10775 [Bifidobacterium vespertilionis]KAA8823818.1 hypothetical protein EM848_04400 [Bifidobacterium vespertilionis]